MTDQFSGLRRTTWGKGEANPDFKGDKAGVAARRLRAHKYPLRAKCDNCEAAAVDRHHVDGNVGNNAESNIAHLCRRCHMEADGRLKRLGHGPKRTVPPRPCLDCGKPSKPLRKGRCHKCEMKHRRRLAGSKERDKSRCKNGHPSNDTNTWMDKLGHKHCRVCHKEREKARREKLRRPTKGRLHGSSSGGKSVLPGTSEMGT